jgi:hypothetical protein
MVRTGADVFAPFTFAHRALWAAAIFLRAAAETVRFGLCALVWMIPVRLCPTNSSIARMA